MKEKNAVKIGQMWRDTDPRRRQRFLTITSLSKTKAECEVRLTPSPATPPFAKTIVSIDRLQRRYSLYIDVPMATATLPPATQTATPTENTTPTAA